MELTSNQASETFQATLREQYGIHFTALAAVVNVAVHNVQSFVHVSVFDAVVVPRVQAALYSSILRRAEAVATFVVLTKHESLYFVLHFIGIEASKSTHL